MRWAALLKGFNVGGKRMPMGELKKNFEGAGLRDAKTLLASGNIVFDSEETDGSRLEAAIEAMLAGHGLKVAVLVRNAEEIRAVIAANPFPEVAEERPNQMIVTFHRENFPTDALGRLAEIYEGPERLKAHGRELYADYPDGQGKSKLSETMPKAKFPKIATARNWNTVVKLAEMLEA